MLRPVARRYSEGQTLTHILAVRLAAVSLAAFVALFAFFFIKYMADIPALRHATLQADTRMLISTIDAGDDPAALHHYRYQPPAYAFRVLERRTSEARKVLAEANTELLPGGAAAAPGADTVGPGALERSFDMITRNRIDGTTEILWMLTERASLGGRPVWIQVAMFGDPDWRWRTVIQSEMLDHVVVPALVIVPALALAMFLAIRNAMYPLLQITRQASALGAAVAGGQTLTKLPEHGLPREFRRVVVALNAMIDKLETSLRLQKQFTADAAHQLRTPLSILTLEISQLPPGPVTGRIAEELAGLTRLVNQLLRLAQAEDAMASERRQIDVSDVARKACEVLATLAVSRGLQIEFDAPAQPVLTSGHAVLVDVAISNIVDNALRHSPPHGIVSVAVEPGPLVIVEDRGAGVPDHQKDAIFDRFWRADPRNGEGTGIGLALVRRIAQLHGGDVRVEDRKGGGARFLLTFAPIDRSRVGGSTGGAA